MKKSGFKKMKKASLIVIAAVLALLAGSASAVEIASVQASLKISDSGSASIVENYFLSFSSDFEVRDFEKIFERNSSSLIAWKAFNEKITAHFGNEGELLNVKFSFDKESKVLKSEYGMEKAIVEKALEDSRSVVWRFKPTAFSKFEKGALTVIPENFKIEVELPFNSRVNRELLPEQVEVLENTIKLENLSASNLIIEYGITKPIAPPINTFEALQTLLESEWFLAVIAVIVAVAVIGFWKRKTIGEKIEDYIVEHSEIAKHEEEEFELEEE